MQELIHDGEACQGRAAIVSKLKSVAQMHAGFKVAHIVTEVDCQPLGMVRCSVGGLVMVLCVGGVRLPPEADHKAAGDMCMHCVDRRFTDDFSL